MIMAIYRRAAFALSDGFWGDGPRRPAWAVAVWRTRGWVPRSWWDS